MRLPNIAVLCAALSGTASAAGFPVTRGQVCRALGIPTGRCEAVITVLGEPTAKLAEPDLRLHRLPDSREMAQVRCEALGCLPFYVRIGDAQLLRPHPVTEQSKRTTLPFLIQRGDVARLVDELDGMRLSRRVVCEERGRLGDTIRVRLSGTQQRMHAVVIAGGQLGTKEMP